MYIYIYISYTHIIVASAKRGSVEQMPCVAFSSLRRLVRILFMIAHARVLLMIERGCYALYFSSPSPHANRDT